MEPKFLTAKQVRARFGGISDMSLWRWLQDEQLGFPRPLIINRRRFFVITHPLGTPRFDRSGRVLGAVRRG